MPNEQPSKEYTDRVISNEILKFVLASMFGIVTGIIIGITIMFPLMLLRFVLIMPKLIWIAIFGG